MAPLNHSSNSSSCSISSSNGGGNSDPLLLGNLMECVCIGLEHSIDLLSCDANTVRKVHDVYLNPKPLVSAADLAARDYAKLHDEFIESLLQEQQKMQLKQQLLKRQQLLQMPPQNEESATTIEDAQLPPSDLTNTSPTYPIGEILTVTPRKRRVVKLSRRSPRHSPRRQVTPFDDTLSLPDDTSVVTHITQTGLPDPPLFLDEKCKLQKDKNKGEPVGSEICAFGKRACLEKLRQKMELLTQVAMGKSDTDPRTRKKASASMKRRKAKISEETALYTETRSIIELRMGFLSMQYGILLRWDTTQTGKIFIVVLRKMCPESFYLKESVSTRPVPQQNDVSPVCWSDNHAIWTRRDKTEVSLLEPPYRIHPPLVFAPTLLTITVIRLTDFDTRSNWTICFTINGQVQKILYRHGHQLIGSCLDWELPHDLVEVDLDISLVEQKRTRNKRKRGKQYIVLHLLDDNDDNRQVPMSCGTLQLQVRHQSEYCQWLRRELGARHQDDVPFLKRVPTETTAVDPDEDELFWDCCAFW